MTLTQVAKNCFLFLFVFATSVFAAEVEVVNKTDLFGSGKKGKPVKIGSASPGQRFQVISQKGSWYAVNHNGKSVWIAAKNVREMESDYGDDRAPASYSSASIGSPLSVNAALGIQTGGAGFGPGIGGFYKATKLTPKLRLDAGLGLFFFPSGTGTATTSVSSFELLLNGRVMYPLAEKMEIGGELGFVYFSASTSSTLTPGVSVGTSSMGMNLGGVFSYNFAKQWNALGNLRMIFAGGSVALLSAGVEYSF